MSKHIKTSNLPYYPRLPQTFFKTTVCHLCVIREMNPHIQGLAKDRTYVICTLECVLPTFSRYHIPELTLAPSLHSSYLAALAWIILMHCDILTIFERSDSKERSFFLEAKFLIIPPMKAIDDHIPRIQKTFRYIQSFHCIARSKDGIDFVGHKFNKRLLIAELVIASILINRSNYPDLIVTTMPLPLANLGIIESKSALDIEYFSAECFDKACFTRILAIIDRDYLEEAAGILFGINGHNSPIVWILILDSYCHILADYGESVVDHVVSIDVVMLRWGG